MPAIRPVPRRIQVDDRSEERLSALLTLYGASTAVEVQLPVLLATSDYARKVTKP